MVQSSSRHVDCCCVHCKRKVVGKQHIIQLLTLTPSRRVKIPFSRGIKHGPSSVTHVSSLHCCFKSGSMFETVYKWHWTHRRRASKTKIASTFILVRGFQRKGTYYWSSRVCLESLFLVINNWTNMAGSAPVARVVAHSGFSVILQITNLEAKVYENLRCVRKL